MDIFNLSFDEDFRPFPKLAGPGVYAYWDAEGTLLYIGQSGDVKGRRRAHERTKKWGDQIATALYCPLADASERLIAETVLILRHFPKHNRSVKLGISSTKGRVHEIQFIKSTR